ncbi:hypothetical protein LCGC14_1368680 [marine sediment metagenome]|uniref:Uncharacterized protein n=1 Tax=marine sediment metagenome TaxID=412755 RepID=A0A0F9K5Z6_9ZZZZ
MMIEIIQDWIWNVGGFSLTVALILAALTAVASWIINRASWWFKKDVRENLFYWIKNKKRLNEIIEKEKLNTASRSKRN